MEFEAKGTLVLNGISYSGGSSSESGSAEVEYYEEKGYLSRNLLKREKYSSVEYDVTLLANGDEYVVNGTATGGTAIFTIGKVHLEQGKKYKVIGSKGSSADAFAYVVANGQWKRDYSTTNNPFISEITEDADYIIRVVSGKTANNLTFRPMVSENVDDDYDTFMPYVPSNANLQKQIDDLANKDIKDLGSRVTETETQISYQDIRINTLETTVGQANSLLEMV